MSQDGFIDTYEDLSHTEKKPETGFFGGHREPVRGRKWDHAREGDPVIMQSGVLPTSSPWRTYIKSSMYGPAISEDAKQVDEEFLQQQTPGYQKPWRGDLEGNEDSEKLTGLLHLRKQRRSLIKRFQVWKSWVLAATPLTHLAHSPHASKCTADFPNDRADNIDNRARLGSLCTSSFRQV